MASAIFPKLIILTSCLLSSHIFSASLTDVQYRFTATQCTLTGEEVQSKISHLQQKYPLPSSPLFDQAANYYQELNTLVKKALNVGHIDTVTLYVDNANLQPENIVKSYFLIHEMGLTYKNRFPHIQNSPFLPMHTQNEFRILKNLTYNLFFNASNYLDPRCIELSKSLREKKDPSKQEEYTDDIDYFNKEFGQYPPLVHTRFKYKDLVISTMRAKHGYEGAHPANRLLLKIETSVQIKNGRLYGNIDGNGYKAINTTAYRNNIWVFSKIGEFFAINIEKTPYKHSYLLKNQGYGIPVAAAGEFEASDGKIYYLNNCSGHYSPNEDQLLLAAYQLYKQGVLANDIVIQKCKSPIQYSLSDIKTINRQAILSRYRELDYTSTTH